MQVTINLEEDLIDKLDEGANREGLSRSKYVKKCVTGYFDKGGETDSDKAKYVNEITQLQKEIDDLRSEVNNLHNQNERDKAVYVDKITELQNERDFLRNENSMLLARIPVALPPAKPILTRIKELFRRETVQSNS